MSTRLHTQDPTKRLTYLGVRQRAIREHLLQRLTEKQYRRVALLYGFDGEPMSFRDVAKVEGVYKRAVEKSRNQALRKLRTDVYLWALWLLCRFFRVADVYEREKGEAYAVHEAEKAAAEAKMQALRSVVPHPVGSDELSYGEDHQKTLRRTHPQGQDCNMSRMARMDPRPGKDSWASDRYHPESRYDRQVDELNEKYETGQITRIEWEVELLLAYVEDQNPKASDFKMDDLRQELEWAFGGQELGIYSHEKTQQLVSKSLRSYVNGE